MSEKTEERFKDKIKDIIRRSHHLDANVVAAFNRVIRGTVRYFSASFTTGLSRFNELDQYIQRRIRSMKFKRIWKSDNYRFLNKHIHNRRFITCREVYLSAS